MSKSVSIDQSHSIIQALANNVDWESLDGGVLQEKIIRQQKEAGKQFTAFLKNGGRMIIDNPKLLIIDRSVKFSASTLMKSFGVEDFFNDELSLTITRIDVSEILFETVLEVLEKVINGKERKKRLKEKGHLCLDGLILKKLWDNKHLIPKKWKENFDGKTRYILFDGTTVFTGGSNWVSEGSFCLFWGTDNEWHITFFADDNFYCGKNHVSAVINPKKIKRTSFN